MSTITALCRWCNNPFQTTSWEKHQCCSPECSRNVRSEIGRKQKPRDTQKEQEIISLYISGKTTTEIGQQYHISWQRVSQILKRAKCETRGRGRKSRQP